jgi:hypothetical protein
MVGALNSAAVSGICPGVAREPAHPLPALDFTLAQGLALRLVPNLA